MKTFVVIGLGRFGSSVAEELCQLGHQVLAVDTDEEVVQHMAHRVTRAVVGDCSDPEVLEALGVKNMDCAVVGFSDDIGTSALITLNLKELGIPRLICKARDLRHQELLRRIGADDVIIPEHEIGRKLAHMLTSREIITYIELAERYGIVKLKVPSAWQGKTLRDLDVRANFQVNIIAIESADGSIQTVPRPDYAFRPEDLIFTLGQDRDNDRIIALE